MNSPKCTLNIFLDSQAIKQRVSEGMTDRKAVVDLLVPGRLPRVRAIISRQRVRLVSNNQRRNVRYVYLQIIDDSDVRLGVKDNVDNVDVYGGGQQGQLSGWYSVHPGAWGLGEAQKVHGSSLIQVCCIYLPIVIIQHTSTLSNCGNHTRVFQFYGLYWWLLSIYVFKHLFGCNTTYYA